MNPVLIINLIHIDLLDINYVGRCFKNHIILKIEWRVWERGKEVSAGRLKWVDKGVGSSV